MKSPEQISTLQLTIKNTPGENMLLSKESLSKMNQAPSRVLQMRWLCSYSATLSNGTEVDHSLALVFCQFFVFCFLLVGRKDKQRKIIKFQLY